MRPPRLLALLVLLALAPGAPAQTTSAPAAEPPPAPTGLARALPPDALLLVSVPDLTASIQEIRALPLGRILADADVKAFLAQPLEALEGAWEQARAGALQGAGIDPGVALATRWKAIEIGVPRLRFSEGGFEFGIAGRLDAGEGWPAIRDLLGRAAETVRRTPDAGRVEESALGGRTWTLLHPPEGGGQGGLFWSAEGTAVHFAFGSPGSGVAEDLLARVAGTKAAPSLAEDPDFLACALRCGATPDLSVFLRVRPLIDVAASALGRAGGGAPAFLSERTVRTASAALGLDGARAFAFASTAEKDHWRNDLFLLAPSPRKGLLALGGEGAPDRELLKRVPPDAVSFSAGGLDAEAIRDGLLALVAGLGPEAEAPVKDLLVSLGASRVSYSMRSTGLFAPAEGAHLVRLRDPAAFEKAAAALAGMVGGAVAFADLKETVVEGTKIRSLALKPGAASGLPQGLPFNPAAMFSPAFAVRGDVLLCSMNAQGLRRALARLGSEPGPGAETSPGYRRFADRVPAKAVSIAYGDPVPTVQMFYGLATSILPMATQGANLPVDWSALPAVESITAPLFGSVGYGESDAEGIHLRSFSSFGADRLVLLAGAALGGAGVVASRSGPGGGGSQAPAPPVAAGAELLAGLQAHASDHVRLMTDVDAETAARLGAEAETVYGRLRDLFGGEPAERPLLVYGYATDAAYNRFAGSFGDDHSAVYGAYVASRESSRPVVATFEGKDWASLYLSHGLTHLFVRALAGPERAGSIPAWFEEGIATYVERFSTDAHRAWSIENLNRRGGVGALRGFGEGFQVSASDGEGSRRRMLQAGLLVAYYAHGSDAAELEALKEALLAVREGTPADVRRTTAALLGDPQALETKLRAFAVPAGR